MSGICGLIHKDGKRKVDEDRLQQMAQAMAIHPDQEPSIRPAEAAGFGVTSSLTDRYIYTDNNLVVCCEGEFYNRREITDAMEGRGHRLKGPGEAELCAALYREFGIKLVDKLRGIFSIAVWDKKEESLFLATDPFSIKPVIYYNDSRHFIFGSKIRAIQKSNLVKKEIEPDSLLNYFFFHVVPTPGTIYRDILKLPPGHFIILKNGRFSLKQYWDMCYPEDTGNNNEDYWAGRVLENVKAAVKQHLDYNAGEGVGTFLSGGTDSSTVAGIVKGFQGKVKTFSIGFSEEHFNEMHYARITANHFNTDHHEYFVKPEDAYNIIPSIIKMYDEPFGNASVIPSYFCSRLAADNGVRVLLAGDGGDEIFAGNERYVANKVFSIYQSIPKGLRKGLLEPFFFNMPQGLPPFNKVTKYINRSNIPNPQRFISYNFLESTGLTNIFDTDFLESTNGQENYLEIINAYYRQANTQNDLNRQLYMDLKLAITDNDLVKVNGAAELAGINVRYPFLEGELVEFSGTIPVRLKIKGFKNRYIFKKAMKNFLPIEVIKKKKHGFGLPISVWLRENRKFRELSRDALLSVKSAQRGYFKKGFVQSLFDKHDSDASNFYGDILWVFLVQELWHTEHYD